MRTKSIIALSFTSIMLLINSCTNEVMDNNNKGGEYFFSSCFITRYYTMDAGDLILDTYDEGQSIYTFVWQGSSSDYYTKDHNSNEYNQLCYKYGDSGLNAYLEKENLASTNSFNCITITCDSEFPGHPVGNNLNDIVFVRLLSAKPFIDSGYSNDYLNSSPILIDGNRLISSTEGWTEVCKLAKDISKEDLMLISRYIRFEFHDRPVSDNKDVVITVALEQEGATPIVSSYGVNFSRII